MPWEIIGAPCESSRPHQAQITVNVSDAAAAVLYPSMRGWCAARGAMSPTTPNLALRKHRSIDSCE
jgi:ribosomal protein S12